MNSKLFDAGLNWFNKHLDKCKVENPIHKNCKKLKNVLFVLQTNKETKEIEQLDLPGDIYFDVAKLAEIAVNTDNVLNEEYDITGVGELFDILMIQVRSV